MLRVRLAPDGLQRVHIHPSYPNRKDLYARLPCLCSHLFHCVLRPPVGYNHGDSRDVQVCCSCPIFLCEGYFHGVLDCQAGHCSRGKVPHVPHRLLHLSLAGEGVEGEFRLDHAAVLQQTNPGGVWPDLQELDQINDEGLDLLVVVGAYASRAVDDKDEVQRDGFARVLWDRRGKGLCSATPGLKAQV